MNKLVVCILMYYLYIWWVRCLLHSSWPNSSQLLRAEHRFLSRRVADPGCWSSWLWQCTSLHVLMSGSPVVQPQPHCSVTRECESVSLEGPKAQHRRDQEEGGAATKDGAEQSAREQNCGKGLRTRKDKYVYTTAMQAHVNPLICTVGRTVHAERLTSYSHRHTRNHPPHFSQALYHDLSSCSFPNPGKNPLLPLAWTSHGICLLQYDVSRHPWPQLSRKTVSQEKGISALWRALGHLLLGAFILMPHTKLMPNTAM